MYDFLSMAVLPISNRTDSSLGSAPRVLLEPLYPVCSAYHRLDAVVVVQIREVCLVGRIMSSFPDATVILSPTSRRTPAILPRLSLRYSSCLRYACRRSSATSPLSPLRTSLTMLRSRCVVHRWSFVPGEHLTDDILQHFQTAHISPTLPTPRSYRSFSISPQHVALSVGLLYMPNTSRVLSSFTTRMT